MAFVADASITLAWYFPDEATEQTNALREQLQSEKLYVPAHWALEVTNAMLAARRRGRLGDDELKVILADLRLLPEEVDRQTDQMAWDITAGLAEAYGLTTYDAAYLELARRRSLPLATLDRQLRDACKAAGVEVLP